MSAAITTLRAETAPKERTSRIVQTAAYFAAFIALGLTTGSLGPTLPALATQTRVGLSAISYVFMSRSLGYVLGSRGGRLFDRMPGNKMLGSTLAVMAAIMALVPLTSSFWLLIVAMFVLGAAESAVDVGANILLVWAHGNRGTGAIERITQLEPRSRPPGHLATWARRLRQARSLRPQRGAGASLNALHSFFGIGALLSPVLLAGIVAFGFPAMHVYFVIALMLLPAAGWLLPLPGPPAQTTNETTEKVKGNGGIVFLIALFLFLYVGAEVGFGGWIFTYATVLKLSTTTVAAYLTSCFWGMLTLGRILTVPIAKRFRHTSILFIDLAGCLTSVAIIILFPNSLGALTTGVCGLGLFMASMFPTLLAFADKQLHLTGQMTGGFITGASLGAMLVPLVIGQFFDAVGPRIVILFAASLLIAMSVVMAILYRASQRWVTWQTEKLFEVP
jgi:FHS family Na+ dependent glucose MFS transporter 1